MGDRLGYFFISLVLVLFIRYTPPRSIVCFRNLVAMH